MTTNENGCSLLCNVTSVLHSLETSTKRERVFFFYRMPDSCIVFGDNNKSDSENGRALHITFFLQSSPRVIEKKEKMDRLCNLSKFMLVSRANETLR